MIRARSVGFALAIGLLVVACGDDEEDGRTTSGPSGSSSSSGASGGEGPGSSSSSSSSSSGEGGNGAVGGEGGTSQGGEGGVSQGGSGGVAQGGSGGVSQGGSGGVSQGGSGGVSQGGSGGVSQGGSGGVAQGGAGGAAQGGGGQGGGVLAICGDGTLEAGEECDDGATAAGDCCSATCAIEAGCEIEINDTQAQANDFAAIQLTNKVWGFITPASDIDYWQVVIPAGPNVILTAETVPGILGTACDNNTSVGGDSFLTIYDSFGMTLDTDDDGGFDYCSLASATNLAPGTYYIAVEASSSAGTGSDDFDYGLTITTTPIICGNGVITAPETCDDNNTAANDGCSAICTVEAGWTCSGTPSVCTNIPLASCAAPIVVTNGFTYAAPNITAYGDDLGGFPTASCIIDGTGRAELVFMANLAAGETVNVKDTGNADLVIKMLGGACGNGLTCASAIDFGEDTTGASYTAASAGQAYIVVEAYSAAPSSTAINLAFTISTCGDGAIGPGEACDDGDALGGDGCSATCTVEPGYTCTGAPSVCTNIPLANCAAPIVVTNGFTYAATDMTIYGDDLGGFPTASCITDGNGRSELVFMADLLAGQTVNVKDTGGADLVMKMLGSACANGATCISAIDFNENTTGASYTAASAGPAYIVIETYSTTPGAKDINLAFTISTCGDGAIGPGEACDDADAVGGDGCSATCTIEPGWTCTGTPSVCTNIPLASCTDPIAVTDGFTYAAPDITAYGDELDGFPTASCITNGTGRAEMVFRADLAAGEVLNVKDFGGADLVLKALAGGACGDGLMCAPAVDLGEDTTGLTYAAAAAGPVFIVVETYSTAPGSKDVNLLFSIAQCGDGDVSPLETCDDGNTTPGDGCSATCAVETGFVCTGDPSTCSAPVASTCAAPFTADDGFRLTGANIAAFGDELNGFPTGSCITEGSMRPDIVFAVPLVAGQLLNVKDFGNLDVVFKQIGATCMSGNACLASFDGGNSTEASTGMSYTATVSETVYVVVESYFSAPSATSTYDIQFSVTP